MLGGCLWCKETKNRKRLLLIGVLNRLDLTGLSRNRSRSRSERCGKEEWVSKSCGLMIPTLCFELPEIPELKVPYFTRFHALSPLSSEHLTPTIYLRSLSRFFHRVRNLLIFCHFADYHHTYPLITDAVASCRAGYTCIRALVSQH